jgi:hypothetical protein
MPYDPNRPPSRNTDSVEDKRPPLPGSAAALRVSDLEDPYAEPDAPAEPGIYLTARSQFSAVLLEMEWLPVPDVVDIAATYVGGGWFECCFCDKPRRCAPPQEPRILVHHSGPSFHAHWACVACMIGRIDEWLLSRKPKIKCYYLCHINDRAVRAAAALPLLNSATAGDADRARPLLVERRLSRVDAMPDTFACPTRGCPYIGFAEPSAMCVPPERSSSPTARCEICKRCWCLPKPEKPDEERASRTWTAANARACPGCGLLTIKDGGCNQMRCCVCRTLWYWKCQHTDITCDCARQTESRRELTFIALVLTVAAFGLVATFRKPR